MNSSHHTTSIYPPPFNISQSDVTNSTEALPQIHHLVHSPDGWEGSGTHFRVRFSVFKIKNTDAEASHVPSKEKIRDEEGNFSQYVQVHHGDSIYQLWMNRIGPYLADWVLGKHPNANPPWKLMRFPENYTLWIHKKGVDTDPANPRIDAYLFGAPHLGPSTSRISSHQLAPTVFRSPMEFVEHAIWLMRGCAGQCQCKYCTPGQSQKAINLRLNRGVEHDSDPESDDGTGAGGSGGGGGSGRNTTHASSSSSRRGATAGARRARRGGPDRSPPIMYKDYRVGNPGPAS